MTNEEYAAVRAALLAGDANRKPVWLHLNRGELDAESVDVCKFCFADWPCDPVDHQATVAGDAER